MKRLVLSLMLALSPLIASAQEDPFDTMMARLEPAIAADDSDAIYAILNSGLREARDKGQLTSDWAIFYAMLTDAARINKNNPAYALQLAEEGLALVQSDDGFQEMGWALEVSRAYALADLGRFSEAVEAGRTALPLYRTAYGDEAAEDFADYLKTWETGELGEFNRSALEIAEERLAQAEAQFDAGEFGRAIATAQAARIAVDGTLGDSAPRGVNFRAEHFIARAQMGLLRYEDACNAFLAGMEHVAPGWGAGQPDWQVDLDAPGARATIYTHLSGLANCAIQLGRRDIAEAALGDAERLAPSPAEMADAMVTRAVLHANAGDWEGARRVLEESVEAARASGNQHMTVAAEFYAALVSQKIDVGDPQRLLDATNAILAMEGPPLGAGFVLREAAQTLVRTGYTETALDFAEAAVARQREALLSSTDSQFGTDQARAAMASAVETLLSAAHLAAERSAPLERCPEAEYRHCVIIE